MAIDMLDPAYSGPITKGGHIRDPGFKFLIRESKEEMRKDCKEKKKNERSKERI
jgi:hypothetical protein